MELAGTGNLLSDRTADRTLSHRCNDRAVRTLVGLVFIDFKNGVGSEVDHGVIL
jgi:hypothetical protein